MEAVKQELAARDLVAYSEYVHEPALPTAPHHREWADLFMNPSRSRPHTLIIAPPGSSKTSWASKFFPCLAIGQNPNLHVGIVAATAKRAWKLSLSCRDTITDLPKYRAVFPHVKPDRSKGWARDQWFIERTRKDDPDPTINTCGLFGDLLGSRLELLILDDVFDEETAASETLRTRGRNWVRNTAMTRLDPNTGRAIAILTRWSGVTEDLVAEFEKDKRWNIVRMPAINYYGDGGSLWEDRLSLEFLQSERERDPLSFEAVYQGNPSMQEGDLFKRAWWAWMEEEVWPQKFEMVVQSWDTAFKKGRKNDYSACVTLGILRGHIYVINVYREKLTWPELVAKANEQFKTFHPRTVLIEDSASGQSLLQQLKVQSKPMIPVQEAVRGQQDKRAFVSPVTGYVQAARVVLPKCSNEKERAEINRFVNSCAAFNPDREQKDDDVIAFAHGIRWLTKTVKTAFDDDCIIVTTSEESRGVGASISSNLQIMGSGGSRSSEGGGGHWFDNM